ncbi:MAG: single-stranded-DNA-specific exonuclease RecJ [Arcobacter sp.]|uniref:single-stranded-DNA-specific exonuclease RecJ n=1 Tax=Arcobacter sp. TaxID=1872629 RepID=UPI003B000864
MSKVTKQKLFDILSARHEKSSYSKLADIPPPTNFKDIDKATKRVKKAILDNEKITIVGDYDVDGVVSTSIMVDFFNKIAYEVEYIIPNRFEHGYGLSTKICDLINEGIVITVDNGISACEATELLNNKNIDVIITDHHTVGDSIPNAYAIINPKQQECNFPFKDICGAQVAWYFCASIKKELNLNINMSDFLDLLCIAIIADMMPMTSLNYTMVRNGLKKIETSKRVAISHLRNIMRKNTFVSDDIGFIIAPKINSAGRMEDASIALSFLLSDNIEEANESLELLEELNNRRKTLQEEISLKAKYEIDINDKAIVVWGENWHEGVIGIVASKLSHAFKRPAFIFSIKDGIAKGSARANADINLHSIISQAQHLLLGFGGHKNAAGINMEVKHLEEFKAIMNSVVSNTSKELYIEPITLGELDVSSVDLEFMQIIESFEPYGLENHKPIFKITNAEIIKSELFGREKNHLKLFLNSDGFEFEAIKFYSSNINKSFIDMVISVNKNEFRGNINPQFLIQDIL